MTKILIQSQPYYQFIKCDGANTVLVVFASRKARPPKFTWWKTCNRINAHLIFVNSDAPEWYRTGIPGIKGGISGAVNKMQKFKENVGATRLVMTGNSMGGYGALLYGSVADADEVLAFGVEPLLGVPGGKTENTRNQFQYIYPDLTSLKLPKTTVYYGGMDVHDIIGAWLLKSRNKATVTCIQGAKHNGPDFLARSGRLDIVINDLVAGNCISHFEYKSGDAANKEVPLFLWSLINFIVAKDWRAIRNKIDAHQRLAQISPVVAYYEGLAHLRCEDFSSACYALIRLLAKVPTFWKAWLNLGAALLKLDKIDAAIKASECAMKLDPQYASVHIQLANAYQRANLMDMACDHVSWACKLNYSRQEYFDKFADMAKKTKKTETIDKSVLKKEHSVNHKRVKEQFADYSHFEDINLEWLNRVVHQ